MNLTFKILIGMGLGLALGVVLNIVALPDDHVVSSVLVNGVLYAGGRIFIALLQLMVVPLVFVSLVCGASNLSDWASMGRIGGKTIGLYLITTAVAITMAITVAIFVQPGVGMDRVTDASFVAREAPPLLQVVIDIVPRNPVAAMADGRMLQIIVFALFLGIALPRAGEAGKRMKSFFEDLNEVILQLVLMLIQVAPYGVFCLMASVFAQLGMGAIVELAAYFFTVFGVLMVHLFGVYMLLVVFLARLNPRKFYGKMWPVMIFAFSSSSSNATLPVTLSAVRNRLGVGNNVASFTVPLGATINMDGTAIMQGVATVFIAQAFNIDLTFQQYLLVILTATMASIGTAGVPGVGLIMLSMVLTQVGLPVEGVGMILAIDRLLDMTRTAVNITGDAMVSCIVGKSEGEFDQERFDSA